MPLRHVPRNFRRQGRVSAAQLCYVKRTSIAGSKGTESCLRKIATRPTHTRRTRRSRKSSQKTRKRPRRVTENRERTTELSAGSTSKWTRRSSCLRVVVNASQLDCIGKRPRVFTYKSSNRF
ncbi:hypothetical protein PUN28_015814 [Cardiocondyla obscurior]|uniref:Uncharacterized protein n=1 Tax=Cardiocondyla obscurior TaxID=286306 RepID=A0AAW2EV85_9HYME